MTSLERPVLPAASPELELWKVEPLKELPEAPWLPKELPEAPWLPKELPDAPWLPKELPDDAPWLPKELPNARWLLAVITALVWTVEPT